VVFFDLIENGQFDWMQKSKPQRFGFIPSARTINEMFWAVGGEAFYFR